MKLPAMLRHFQPTSAPVQVESCLVRLSKHGALFLKGVTIKTARTGPSATVEPSVAGMAQRRVAVVVGLRRLPLAGFYAVLVSGLAAVDIVVAVHALLNAVGEVEKTAVLVARFALA